MLGVLFPLVMLIIPVFVKKYRENFWTKTNIVIIVNTILLVITYVNKEYYWSLWFESGHWTRDNCPPIRWDFWNIIGKSA